MKRTIVLLWLVLSGSVLESQVDQLFDTVSIENVTVTHSKIPLSLQNTAKPIQIITNDALSRNAGSDISQLLNDVAGIDVVGSLSNPGLNKSVFLRGASGEYTLILLNGQPIIDPSGLGGVADLRSISTNDVQRIEILKGSQSAIYGSDAIAGVINIITDQNANQPVTGHIRGAFGSFNSIDANAGVSASINDLSIRISGAREVSDGISEALELGDGDTFDKDGFSRTALSGNMTYDLSSKLKWGAFALYSDYEADTDAGSFTDDMSTYETELLSLGTSLTYSSEKMNAALKYTNTSTDRNFESAFGAFPFFGRFNNWDAWVSLPINDDIKVIGGVNYQDHKMLDESTTIVDPNEQIISPYLSLLGKLGQRTNFEAGLRYNDHSKFGGNANYSFALSHWITDELKAFANIGTGFKAPNLFQLYGAFGANPELKPQRSQSIELGVQAPIIGGLVNPQITFFNRKVEDVIAFGASYLNQDEQNDLGVELETGYYLNDDVLLKFNYTYLTGEVSTLDFFGDMLQFNNLYRRPKHQFLLAAYISVNDHLSLDVSLKNVGERTDVFFNLVDFSQSEVILDEYVYGVITANYDFSDQFKGFLTIKNLFDNEFQEVVGFNTPGINFKLGASFQFQ